ncbi:MAG TPA: hypothetical protein VGN60_12100 [Devosia sp.]|jgi:hypothetical protein|nr:hypothetical protein [Devosia sp.]
MKIWAAVSNAVAGWSMILRGEAGWRERFALSRSGLTTAVVIFIFATFVAVAIASMSVGLPSVFGLVAAMFALALPLTSLVVVLLATRMAINSTDPTLDVMVPGTYALVAFLFVEGALAVLGGPVVMLAWIGLGYMLYRLARAATSWTAGISAGFAVLTVLLLVAMRMALYMISSAGNPT